MPTNTKKIYNELDQIVKGEGVNRSSFTVTALVEGGFIRPKERGEGYVWSHPGHLTINSADIHRQAANERMKLYMRGLRESKEKVASNTDLLSAKQVAAIWKKSRNTIHSHIESGLLAATKFEHQYIINRSDVVELYGEPQAIEPVEAEAEVEVTVPAGTVFTEELLCDLIKRLQPSAASVKTKILEADNVIDALHVYHESIMKLHASHERQMREMDERLSKVTVTLVDLAESNKKLREMIQTLAGLVELQSNAVRYQIRGTNGAHSIA